jgi:hypothetical protein
MDSKIVKFEIGDVFRPTTIADPDILILGFGSKNYCFVVLNALNRLGEAGVTAQSIDGTKEDVEKMLTKYKAIKVGKMEIKIDIEHTS